MNLSARPGIAAALVVVLTGIARAQSTGVVPIQNTFGPSSITQGYGVASAGGTGGSVYHVTTLADSGPGSLRDAIVNRSGPRIVDFDVAGLIVLQSDILINQPYLTVDGSNAPSPGITVQRGTLYAGQLIIGGTHDIILRQLRLRGLWQESGQLNVNAGGTLVIDGDSAPDRYAHHMLLDHLTSTNATDGAPDIWGNVSDVTLSWSFMYYNHHPTSLSHYPAPYQPRRRISLHHNVYARNSERSPQIRADSAGVDVVNNVIYDYGYYGANDGYGTRVRNVAGEPKVSCNIINNYFTATALRPDTALVYGVNPGPDEEEAGPAVPLPQGAVYANSGMGSLYVAGNILPPQNVDQYSTVIAPLPTPAPAQVATFSASELKARVLPLVGVSFRSLSEQTILDDAARAMTGPSRILGDLDRDGDIDADDVSGLRACASSAGVVIPLACAAADLDGDGDCDLDDFGLLQRCISGMNQPPSNANCLK